MDKNLHLYSERAKYAHGKQWFKDFMDYIDKMSSLTSDEIIDPDRYHNMRINYKLYSGIIDKNEFIEFCKEYNIDTEIPKDFKDINIVYEKIKVLEGLEMSRPFYYKVLATNPEATTRKEQEYFGRIRDFVVQTIMAQIKAEIEQQELEKIKGRKLTPQEQEEIQKKIEQEIKAQTPEEVKRYMEREHQDPAEVLGNQLLNYLTKKLNIKNILSQGWKDALIAGMEIYRIFNIDTEPYIRRINPIHFDYDKNSPTGMIQDGEWAVAEYSYSLIDIALEFPELKESELKKLGDSEFYNYYDETYQNKYVNVRHYTWKSLRKIGFLTYIDQMSGQVMQRIVNEDYKLEPEYGDIEIEWKRIPEVYEGWKIGSEIYANMRRVPIIRDLDDIANVKLPYIGTTYDMESGYPVSLVERMKPYQYMYIIVMDRIKKLMSSDKGKLLLMNIGMIPRSQNIDVEKWLYYAKLLNIGFFNPHEEGNKVIDVNANARVMDLSLTSDIQKYIEIANYIENRAGESVGITKQVIGRIGPNEAVGNTKQSITQSSYVLEPFFEIHILVKKELLQYLINIARVAYSRGNKKKLSFVLDDMSNQLLNINQELLEMNTFGIFVNTTSRIEELRQNIITLAQAAMQNRTAELSDLIKVLKTDNIEEAIEILKVAEKEAQQREAQNYQSQQEAEKQKVKEQLDNDLAKIREEGKIKKEIEQIKGEYDIKKQLILSMGFNEDKDLDRDGIPDVLEVAKYGLDAEIKRGKLEIDKKKVDLEEKKLELEKKKIQQNNNNKSKK